MAEGEGGAKIQVVRCPKCGMLLPEPPNFMVYRCGGCDATLQAKKQPAIFKASSCSENFEFGGIRDAMKEGMHPRPDSSTRSRAEAKYVSYRRSSMRSLSDPCNSVDELWGRLKVEDEIRNQGLYSNEHSTTEARGSDDVNRYQDSKSRSYYPDPNSTVYSDYPDRVELLEQDRAEILRKLDELTAQFKQSCDISEVPNNRQSRRSFFPEVPSTLSHNVSQNSPKLHPAADMHYGLHRPSPFHYHGRRYQRSSDGYLFNQLDADPIISYHHGGFYNQHACSCIHCCSNRCLPPAQVPPCPLGCNEFNPVKPFSSRKRQLCRPAAGASPFILCYNCSEMLQVPEGIMQTKKQWYKVRCGSCSQLILFEVRGRRLLFSDYTQNTIDSSDRTEEVLQYHDDIKRGEVLSFSFDNDTPSYNDSMSTEEKIVLPSFPMSSNEMVKKESGINLSDNEKVHGILSSSSSSDGVDSVDSSVISRKDVPNLALVEHFEDPSSNQLDDDPGNGCRSKNLEPEEIILKDNAKQISVGNVPLPTDMNLSAEDYYPNGCLSQDSFEASKDDEPLRVSKGGESFFAGLIKKSFRDFSQLNKLRDAGRLRVSVNGHPISDCMIKKAEKLAGPIHPGDYWYDFRAGFWGVMGHACLGIIPPFIEEFNYPMHKNCAGGNTGVLVNGRELHQRDLLLLASRGLPVTKGRCYIVEISGKVWDEETGEELNDLGKLAPTVERLKCGFGMLVPRLLS
ncbi:Uncharacterized protein AXF42_Ash001057 [Apostasia shenzhenica]|uniref:Uncharacterized protein n=1 Tax=Apostasia shenzhenica TaxID=1088818 RepID=A0A2I0ATU7_9ASPA|nr:Uncharacterized protein AXF42_Ash001057 [Apostasia shenzhenica]